MISSRAQLMFVLHLGWVIVLAYTGGMVIHWDTTLNDTFLPQSAKQESIEPHFLESIGLEPCRNVFGTFTERDWRKK